MTHTIRNSVIASTLLLTSITAAENHDHDHELPEVLVLSEAQQRMLELEVSALRPDPDFRYTLTVPAEITNNHYRTWVVPAPVDSRVLARSIILGQHLEQGDAVATLFSPDIAKLQSELQATADEWRRVRELGRQAVGNQRYLDVQSRYRSLYASARGYGLDENELTAIEAGEFETGIYTLRAPGDGLVLVDSFQKGQWLTAGSELVTLVDESELWAEASLPPLPGFSVAEGTQARVTLADTTIVGEVYQAGHRLDPVTRTMQLRVTVPNHDHLLHPGMFADVSLDLPGPTNALTLPTEALVRESGGAWQVFVQVAPGRYRPVTVDITATAGDRHVVEGLPAGTPVVTRGAFFLAAELAKSTFDSHAH